MPPRYRDILIAGCGQIGQRLGLALAATGARVWGLRRSDAPLPAPIIPVRADLTDPEALTAALDGCRPQAVFYITTPAEYSEAGYRAAFVTGQRNLIEALQAHDVHPAWQCFVSSLSVYAQSDGEWVDESSPTEPANFSGRRLLDGEAITAGAPWPATVVRFAGIYGGGRGRLIRRVRDGSGCVESPPRWTNRIHEDDCVGFLAHLASLPEPERLYLGVDDEPALQCTVMDWLAERLGCPRPPRVAGETQPPRGGNRRARNERLHASGYRPLYPTFREGYAAVLAGSD